MNPLPGAYLDILSSGPEYRPMYLDNPAIAPAFLTPDQMQFRERNRARKYGEGDPDVGGYHLAEVIFDKRDGGATVGMTEVGPSAWYGNRRVGP